MTNNLDKFQKHCNQPVIIKLKQKDGDEEDEFKFKPLNVQQFSTMMVVGDNINKATEKNEGVSPSDAKAMMNLYVDIVKTSYPDLDDDTVENFVVSNFENFGDIVTQLAPSDMDPRKAEALKKLKKMQMEKSQDGSE